MFGMGFMEIFLIAIVAIIALGPEKLPDAMVQVARFLKKFKSGVEDAKSTLDNEINISELKDEANNFKAQIENTKSSVSSNIKDFDLGVNDILNDDLDPRNNEEKSAKKDEDKKVEKVEKIEEAEVLEEKKPKEESTQKASANKFKIKKKAKKDEEEA